MATNRVPRNGYVIVVTLIFSIMLVLVPLPDMVRYFRPEWVVMTLIYWAMALPHRVGIGIGWTVGLLMDIMLGNALGMLAFAYALVVYMITKFYLQLRQYPLWQQALAIMSIVAMVDVITFMFKKPEFDWVIWMPVVTSTLMWPVVYAVLRSLRRSFHVT
jgi:rod shape-determining protein MreD